MKSAERQSLITVEGLNGYWQSRTGGDFRYTATKEWDGGALTPDVLTGNGDVTDVTVTRLWDDSRDGPLLPWLLQQNGRWDTTISDSQTDANLVPTGDVIQYFGRLTGVTPPQGNSSSSAAKKLTLTFSCTRVA